MWTDSHSHIHDESDAEDLLARAIASNVGLVVCVGTDVASSQRAVAFAEMHSEVRAVVGLHPHDASRWDEQKESLIGMLEHRQVVGIGESGLDYHYMHSSAEDQRATFAQHIRLAHEHDLPLVIHTREAWDDTFEVLATEGVPQRTVFHCFTGAQREADRALELGAYLSFSGIVTFPSAGEIAAAAVRVPHERMLVETDAPYLAPVPYRGQRNESAWVLEVGAFIAKLRNESPEEVEAATGLNCPQVFHRP